MADEPLQSHQISTVFLGDLIGLKFDTPFASYVVGFSVEALETVAAQLPGQIRETIAEYKRQKSGLVVAPDAALNTLKGSQ